MSLKVMHCALRRSLHGGSTRSYVTLPSQIYMGCIKVGIRFRHKTNIQKQACELLQRGRYSARNEIRIRKVYVLICK